MTIVSKSQAFFMDEKRAMSKQGYASWRQGFVDCHCSSAKGWGALLQKPSMAFALRVSFGNSNPFPKDWSFAYFVFCASKKKVTGKQGCF
jgi:hypothetical protein